MRRVLAATDFSAGGDRAVAHAVALLPPGGRLTLLHVIAPQQPPGMHQNDDASLAGSEQGRLDRALAQARLRRLIPADLQDRQIEAEVVESSDVTRAILQAAERLDADLVVLGRSGRRTVAAALAGSSARDLARKSPRPVLLVPEAAEGG